MKSQNLPKRIPLIATAVFTVLLLCAVYFLMDYVQALLNSDVEINLAEIATQNEEVITSRLQLEVNNLALVAEQLADKIRASGNPSDEQLKQIFGAYLREKPDSCLFASGLDGKAFTAKRSEIDISGRKYFRLAKQGIRNISDRIISRLSGEEIFVISVPILYEGHVVGSVQKSYSQEQMFALCKLSLFSKQGSIYIINNQGYILISSQEDNFNRESENYFRMIHSGNEKQRKQIENDIRNNKPGFMATTMNGEKLFSAYTPIEFIHEWYLISSISKGAVSPNATFVFHVFYFILCIIVVIFTLFICFILYIKRKQEAQIKDIAFKDTVTKGHTYNKFIVCLENALAQQPEKTFHIVAFDIESFKFINNFYGFYFGDSVLCHIDNIVRQALSPGEIIARAYNDHFVMLLENADHVRLQAMFDAIREINGVQIYLHAGVYSIADTHESINLMVDKANIAAKSVKNSRYERIGIYSERFEQQIHRNEQLNREIEQALQYNEFTPFFQPIVDINTRRLTGAEALARWRTKDGRFISPREFIPISENTGIITTIDMVIFEKTLCFLRQNLKNDIACVPISVNFSRRNLLDEDFFEQIITLLNEYEVPPHLIELEFTESIVLEGQDILERIMHQLHDAHILIVLDDFGVGYSSLDMLKNIPFDVIKISRGFLSHTMYNDRQKAIFSAISHMARDLRIKIIAEGVETGSHVELLREVGCSTAQGFYYCKPLPQELFEKVYRDGVI